MSNGIQYPVKFQFSVASFSPQFEVKDSYGQSIAYVKQKLFKFKEDIKVYRDSSQTELLFTIKANKWIDWSASYLFQDITNDQPAGRIARKGARSLFKAKYLLFDTNDQQEFEINEKSFVTRLLDGLLSEIPILGMFTGYFFNPKYDITNTTDEAIAQFAKKPSLIGRKFEVQKFGQIDAEQEQRILLGLMMMVLLERFRG